MQYKTKRAKLAGCDISGGLQAQQDNSVQRGIYKKLIAAAGKNLTEKQQKVIYMYYYEGKNTLQIAQSLNISPSTVSRRLGRAIKTIKQYAEVCSKIGLM